MRAVKYKMIYSIRIRDDSSLKTLVNILKTESTNFVGLRGLFDAIIY